MRFFLIVFLFLISCEKDAITIDKKVTYNLDSLYRTTKVKQDTKKKNKIKSIFKRKKSKLRNLHTQSNIK